MGLSQEEFTRQRKQHAGAVTGAVVGGDRATVADAAKPVKGCVHDRAARTAGGIGNESDATGIVLEPRIVQTRASPVQMSPQAPALFGQTQIGRGAMRPLGNIPSTVGCRGRADYGSLGRKGRLPLGVIRTNPELSG